MKNLITLLLVVFAIKVGAQTVAKRSIIYKLDDDIPTSFHKTDVGYTAFSYTYRAAFRYIGPSGRPAALPYTEMTRFTDFLDTVSGSRLRPNGSIGLYNGREFAYYGRYLTPSGNLLPSLFGVADTTDRLNIPLVAENMIPSSGAYLSSGIYLGSSLLNRTYVGSFPSFTIARTVNYQHKWRKDYPLRASGYCTDIAELNAEVIIASGPQSSKIFSAILDTAGNELSRIFWTQHPMGLSFEEVWVVPTSLPTRMVVVGYTGQGSSQTYIGVHELDGTQIWGRYESGYCGKPLLFSNGTFSVPLVRNPARFTGKTISYLLEFPFFGNQLTASTVLADSTYSHAFFPNGMVHEGGDSVLVWGRMEPYASSNFRSDIGVIRLKGMAPAQPPAVVTSLSAVKQQSDFQLYPNPASGVVHLYVKVAGPVTLYDMTGKIVLQQQLPEGLQQVSVSALLKGVYMVRIGSQRQKLVVE